MCLIAVSGTGTPITRETFDLADLSNPDGIGIMTAEGFAKFLGHKRRQKAWRYLERNVFRHGIPYAVHFRWTTHGENTRANTHPHVTPDGRFLVMHNGVLSEFNDPAGVRSDTALFVERMLDGAPEPADADAWEDFVAVTERYIGTGNKLAVLHVASGSFHIMNKHCGDYGTDGIWYSNTYSLPDSIDPYAAYRGVASARKHVYDGDYATPIYPVLASPAETKRYRVADTVDRWLDRQRQANGDAGRPRNWQEERDEEAELQAWLELRRSWAASGPRMPGPDAEEDGYTPERMRRDEEEAAEAYIYASR